MAVYSIGRDVACDRESGIVSNQPDERGGTINMPCSAPRRPQFAFLVGQEGFDGPLQFLADRVQCEVNHAITAQGLVGLVLAGNPLSRRLVGCAGA